jgi:hypothetical protein
MMKMDCENLTDAELSRINNAENETVMLAGGHEVVFDFSGLHVGFVCKFDDAQDSGDVADELEFVFSDFHCMVRCYDLCAAGDVVIDVICCDEKTLGGRFVSVLKHISINGSNLDEAGRI